MNKFCIPPNDTTVNENFSQQSNSDRDILTQIGNRQKFDLILADAIDKATTTVCYLTILIIKINNLAKPDHPGDQLSDRNCHRQIATILSNTLKRSGDLVARWDDHHFACILSDTDPAGAAEMAEIFRRKILNLAFSRPSTPMICRYTVSIGAVTVILTDDISCNMLIQRANQALTAADAIGQNQIIININ